METKDHEQGGGGGVELRVLRKVHYIINIAWCDLSSEVTDVSDV